MKINKRYLFLRLITFPIKIALNLFFYIGMSLISSWKWLVWGSQEIMIAPDAKESLITLIEQNEKLIKELTK